jgi:hypothetical protein
MIYRCRFFAPLLTVLCHVHVRAEWNWEEAKTQAFEETDSYVTAVGEKVDFYSDGRWPRDLDNENVSERFLHDLLDEGFALSEAVRVVVLQKGEKWLLKDEPNDQYYLVRLRYGVFSDVHKAEVVEASAVEDALQEGKEIRLKGAVIRGNVAFHGNVQQSAYFDILLLRLFCPEKFPLMMPDSRARVNF